MSQVSIRELRNHGGDVIDRVSAGERLTITRGGKAVAELRPLARRRVGATALLQRWSRIPKVDPRRLQADVDSAVEPTV
ncbi:MAG: type II toxin-antitoxin system Phd/YefM family antitoxin [Candidatus Dormibacteraceae bacterium]